MAYEAQKQAYYNAQALLRQDRSALAGAQRAKDEHEAAYSSSRTQIDQCKNDRHNLEQRLEQVNQIISMLGGSVSERIAIANTAARLAGEAFCGAMRCSHILAASLATVFAAKSVNDDPHTSSALSKCQTERDRIETEIARLRTAISILEQQMQTLSRNIAAQNNHIASLNHSIGVHQYEVNVYRPYIYM